MFPDDQMSNKAIIGIREFNGEKRLAVRLSRRKSARGGCIDMRPVSAVRILGYRNTVALFMYFGRQRFKPPNQ